MLDLTPKRNTVHVVLILVALSAAVGCQTKPPLMRPPNLYVNGDYDLFAGMPEENKSNTVDVLYATDRVAIPPEEDNGLTYGFERSNSLACGIATVEIGNDIPWDELAQASVGVRENNDKKRYYPAMDNVEERLVYPPSTVYVDAAMAGVNTLAPNLDLERESTASLHALIHEQMAHANRREAYIFVHGYNVTFDSGVQVIAELWHFLGRDGLPVAYTWPAGYGGIRGYTVDRESGEFTVFHLKRFLLALAASPDIDKIHIVAHSRGTDVTLTALREIHAYFTGAGLDTGKELKLGNLILAAADLDFQVVTQRVSPEMLLTVPERITLYISTEDRALGLAAWLFGSITRLGELTLDALTPDARTRMQANSFIDIVDARVKRPDMFGHSYFYQDPAVSSDLVLVLRYNKNAGAENGRPLIPQGSRFWDLDETYPDTAPEKLVPTAESATN